MRNDQRLARMVHVLAHMARHDSPLTSEQIAVMLGTNPVVVRRTLASLREAGYVHSVKGHGGGWTLACDLERITLFDIHQALSGPRVFATDHESAPPACAVERAVNATLDDALRQAELAWAAKLRSVALSALVPTDAHSGQCVFRLDPENAAG